MINTLKALSDPHRQNILRLLAQQEMGACEIIHAIGLSQPAISHHLKLLKQAGLITSEKQGKIVYYNIDKKGTEKFFSEVKGFLEEISCFNNILPRPSPLRENPRLCEFLGLKPSVCEKEL